MKYQLVDFTSEHCRPGLRTSKGRISKGAPVISYPSGHICWEATDYIIVNASKWTIETIKTYASQISVFVRFMYRSKLSFSDVSDAVMHEFAEHLKDEDSRNANTSRQIISQCFHLLLWLQRTGRLRGLVIDFDNLDAQTNITIKDAGHSSGGSRHRLKASIFHDCMPARVIPFERRAIQSEVIDLLWESVGHFGTRYRRARAEVILTLLEQTGARVSEVARISTGDIAQAIDTGILSINSAKNDIVPIRKVPIEEQVLDRIQQFIENERQSRVVKTGSRELGGKNGQDMLLLTNKGTAMSSKSITDEVNILKRNAGLQLPAHPHLFRHRHVTLVLNQIHQELACLGLSSLSDSLIMRVNAQYGWQSDEMIHHYNDQLIAELEGWKNVSEETSRHLRESDLRRDLVKLVKSLKKKKVVELDDIDQLATTLQDILKKVRS